MAEKNNHSGLDKVPAIFSKPLWKDRFFWFFIIQAGLWVALIKYFMFD